MDALFVSHVVSESDLAQGISRWLKAAVPEANTFVSSDPSAIEAGARWLDYLEQALRGAKAIVLLCSPESIARPWVNFEAGCAWIQGKRIIPVCHSGLRPQDLPVPISQFEAVDLERGAEACQKLIRAAADLYSVKPRGVDLDQMASELVAFQQDAVTTLDGVQLHPRVPRVAVYGASTEEIERSEQKRKALEHFYYAFLKGIERTGLAVNCCGCEPIRRVFFDRYCKLSYTADRKQLAELNWRVRFYWYAGDLAGFSRAPTFFDHRETRDAFDRDARELQGSQLMVALTGGIGTESQVQRILNYHQSGAHGVNLEQKPLVLLGWFGGTIGKFLQKNRESLRWLTDRYAELKPHAEAEGWEREGVAADLAYQLVTTLHRLAGPVPGSRGR